MQTVKKKLSELHKTEKNIRNHSPRQIKEYIRSLEMFGQIRPLVVTEDGEIIVGNGMFEALTQMGAEECDVYVVAGLSESKKLKLMMADNKVYELGFTDMSSFDDILNGLDGDFDVPGYDSDLLASLAGTADDIVVGYGTYTPPEREAVRDDVGTFKDVGGSPYAPPVRPASQVAPQPYRPQEPDAGEADYEDEGNFIICPHCGKKIWL